MPKRSIIKPTTFEIILSFMENKYFNRLFTHYDTIVWPIDCLGVRSCVTCQSYVGEVVLDQAYQYDPKCMSTNATIINSFKQPCEKQGYIQTREHRMPDTVPPGQGHEDR
ncbi:hypothetical protein RvY_06693 [Ramazzottius varieornatus]|uniref:Uncharacterized protein n=1 Tax=Ramazzottius varieornatus TaxID=947166 RepID=A0A1D1V850_RAMVA|nr:hypothetical protein RvY_06693 [Ramazzottius varieornatus]